MLSPKLDVDVVCWCSGLTANMSSLVVSLSTKDREDATLAWKQKIQPHKI